MKKIYISPKLIIARLSTERLISTSLRMMSGEINDEKNVLVKGDQSSTYRGGNHSVWDDDWSQ